MRYYRSRWKQVAGKLHGLISDIYGFYKKKLKNNTETNSSLFKISFLQSFGLPYIYVYTYLLTYLLTPRCRVLLEKLTGLQIVKKFPAFHGTRMFITALTSVHHLSLSLASPIQSIYPHSTCWRSVLILSTHLCLGLPSGFFFSVSPPRPYTPPCAHPYTPHAQSISFFSILSPTKYWVI